MIGEFSSTAIFFLVGAVTAILVYLLIVSMRNPVLAKLGLRNMVRRPAQTALIIVGLTLSTVIIISSLGTGDTLRYSVERQAIAAYGRVDEIIAPPLLSMLASMANPNADNSQAQEAEKTLQGLMKGGLNSMLALAQGGLPSIDMKRLEQLRTEAAREPLIDGLAGAIVFPTIIRDVGTGQSEPIGFIYAVDDQYPQSFGLRSVNGQPLAMDTLEPGIGNIFLQASSLFAVVPELTRQFGDFTARLTSVENVGIPEMTQVLAALGALLTGVNPDDLPAVEVSLDTLDQLGIDTGPLRALGRKTISLRELAVVANALAPSGAVTGTLPMTNILPSTATVPPAATATGLIGNAAITDTALLSATAALLSSSSLSGTTVTNAAMASLTGISSDLLRAINLNIIGYELDRNLAQFGLQLRQGDLYLNRLGAQRLGATVGDLLEIYIGPLPVRFRVAAVVDEAGPLSALTPVVMLRLNEAQQLLFMNDKVNAVLVSNLGDEMTGMQHTGAVGGRLKVLALDANAVVTIADILSRPEARAAMNGATANLPEKASVLEEGENIPPLLAGILDTLIQSFNFEQMTRPDARALIAATSSARDTGALRELLAKLSVREWLLGLALPAETARELSRAISNLNQFEHIDALNKTTILTVANVGGGVFSSIFSVFGIFSILAALLLIILIFVMLAAERRIEIGVARAVGVQRGQIGQMFMTEGMVYNLLAGALGVLLGVGITYAMTAFIAQLFNDLTGQLNSQASGILNVTFNISWQSMVIAYCVGVLITWLAMIFATGRVSRMNIVTAIRNLPDETQSKRRSRLGSVWSWLFPLGVTGLGGYVLYVAVTSNSLSLVMIASTIALFGLTTLIGRILEETPIHNETGYRIVYTILGLGLIAIWIPPWYSLAPQLAPGMFAWDPTQAPTMFTLGGPLIIVGAILIIMFNAELLSSLLAAILGFIPSLRPVLKTAIAYPLSTRFRTGMTMVLFAMIMATVVVMAVIINTTQSLIRLDDRQTAGFEIRVSPTLLSFFNPVENFSGSLAEQTGFPLLQDIETVGLVTSQFMAGRVAGANQAYGSLTLAGVNNGYLDQAARVYRFQARAAGYADDTAVWHALAVRDDVVVIAPRMFEERRFSMSLGDAGGEGPGQGRQFGAPLQITGAALQRGQVPDLYLELTAEGEDGVTRNHRVQVIGVLAEDTTLAGADLHGSEATLAKLRSVPVNGDDIYLRTRPGADVTGVAAEVERAFVANGLNTSVLAEEYAQRQRLTGGALQLLQGFMALGLLVGIAALGVISIRSVIERRQQVGMLRALGYQKGMVSLSFILESSFISITGLLIGALTGIVLGDNMVYAFFPQIDRSAVATPWLQIGLIVLFAYLFSLLTTILPAWQAARIYPAEALRYE